MSRSKEIRPGSRVPIPCRCCSGWTMPFDVRVGICIVECPGCKRVTEVSVKSREGHLEIRTRCAS